MEDQDILTILHVHWEQNELILKVGIIDFTPNLRKKISKDERNANQNLREFEIHVIKKYDNVIFKIS